MILLSVSIVVDDIGLSVLDIDDDDEKWLLLLLLLLFSERLLGICGLAAEFVVVVDDKGALVEKI